MKNSEELFRRRSRIVAFIGALPVLLALVGCNAEEKHLPCSGQARHDDTCTKRQFTRVTRRRSAGDRTSHCCTKRLRIRDPVRRGADHLQRQRHVHGESSSRRVSHAGPRGHCAKLHCLANTGSQRDIHASAECGFEVAIARRVDHNGGGIMSIKEVIDADGWIEREARCIA